MSKGLEEIKARGVERVHAETHISSNNLKAIFNKEFGSIHPVQFLGFVSILEREYGADLSELRAEFAHYREEHADEEPEQTIVPPTFQSRKKSRGWTYAVAAAAVVVLWLFYSFGSSNGPAPLPAPEPTEEVQEMQLAAPVEQSAEAAATEAAIDENISVSKVEPEPEPIHDTLTIMPKVKLWVGMIGLQTYERKQMVTSDPIPVDTNQSWLFLFGHGLLKIEHNGEVTDYSSKDRMRFLYEDGVMQEITPSEFRERNRGRSW